MIFHAFKNLTSIRDLSDSGYSLSVRLRPANLDRYIIEQDRNVFREKPADALPSCDLWPCSSSRRFIRDANILCFFPNLCAPVYPCAAGAFSFPRPPLALYSTRRGQTFVIRERGHKSRPQDVFIFSPKNISMLMEFPGTSPGQKQCTRLFCGNLVVGVLFGFLRGQVSDHGQHLLQSTGTGLQLFFLIQSSMVISLLLGRALMVVFRNWAARGA